MLHSNVGPMIQLNYISAFGWTMYGFSWWLSEDSALQCWRHKRCELDPWVRKIPWRRKWQSTLVFFPGKPHGQRSLTGYSPWGYKRIRHDLATKQQQQNSIYLRFNQCFFFSVLLSVQLNILFSKKILERNKGKYWSDLNALSLSLGNQII